MTDALNPYYASNTPRFDRLGRRLPTIDEAKAAMTDAPDNAAITNGQQNKQDYTPAADQARQIASYVGGGEQRKNVYRVARDILNPAAAALTDALAEVAKLRALADAWENAALRSEGLRNRLEARANQVEETKLALAEVERLRARTTREFRDGWTEGAIGDANETAEMWKARATAAEAKLERKEELRTIGQARYVAAEAKLAEANERIQMTERAFASAQSRADEAEAKLAEAEGLIKILTARDTGWRLQCDKLQSALGARHAKD